MNLIETEEHMRLNADLLSKQFPDMGFVLIVFPFDEPGISNYISNGKRLNMIKALREAANRIERNQDIPAVNQIMPN